MANVIKEGGLRLVKVGVEQPLEVCLHASGDSATLGIGDAVKSAGSSGPALVGGPYCKTVTRVASGDAIYGVVQGVLRHFVGSGMNLDARHAPASTAMYVLVRKANHADIFAITEDGTLAVTDSNLNANLTGNGGGTTITACNTTTGMSTMMLDTSTAATTATLQLKIHGFEDTADNTPVSANSSVLVSLNNIENAGGTGTVGVQ